jgi:hypothetical protein
MAIMITEDSMHTLFAYIDPGTGATLTQLLLAGTVGIGAIVKLKWNSIRALFSRSHTAETSAGTSEDVLETPDSSS